MRRGCERLVVGSNGLQAIPTHSLACVRTPQTAAAVNGSRPVHVRGTQPPLIEYKASKKREHRSLSSPRRDEADAFPLPRHARSPQGPSRDIHARVAPCVGDDRTGRMCRRVRRVRPQQRLQHPPPRRPSGGRNTPSDRLRMDCRWGIPHARRERRQLFAYASDGPAPTRGLRAPDGRLPWGAPVQQCWRSALYLSVQRDGARRRPRRMRDERSLAAQLSLRPPLWVGRVALRRHRSILLRAAGIPPGWDQRRRPAFVAAELWLPGWRPLSGVVCGPDERHGRGAAREH